MNPIELQRVSNVAACIHLGESFGCKVSKRVLLRIFAQRILALARLPIKRKNCNRAAYNPIQCILLCVRLSRTTLLSDLPISLHVLLRRNMNYPRCFQHYC